MTSVDHDTFSGCSSLAAINVDEGNEYYCSRDGVLYSKDMTELLLYPVAKADPSTFDVPEGVTTICDYAFSGNKVLKEVIIGNSVTTIGEHAFQNCTGLEVVTLGNSVTTIGAYAFMDCIGLEVVTLGNSVTTISDHAFDSCTGLTHIYSANPTPPTLGSSVFQNMWKTITCPLSVPTGSKEAYSQAEGWSAFPDIEEDPLLGVSAASVSDDGQVASRYTLDGKQVSAPQKGINIIRYANGTVRKVIVK